MMTGMGGTSQFYDSELPAQERSSHSYSSSEFILFAKRYGQGSKNSL